MNNFEKVFLVIKTNCEKQKTFAQIGNFAAIAKEANIPIDKLGTYLAHLQDLDMIKYSIKEGYIHLTELGHTQDKLPTIQQI